MDVYTKMRATVLKTFSVLFYLTLVVTVIQGNAIHRCPNTVPRSSYLKTFRDRCIQFVAEQKWWGDARGYCQIRGGDLIEIKDAPTMAFVKSALQSLNWGSRYNGIWIGAHDLGTEMDWRWVSGVKVDSGYKHWANGQPSCPWWSSCHEDCANMRLNDNFLWHDYGCSSPGYIYTFMCEYKMLPPTTPKPTTQAVKPTTPRPQPTTPRPKPTSMSTQSTRTIHKTSLVSTTITSSPGTKSSLSSSSGSSTYEYISSTTTFPTTPPVTTIRTDTTHTTTTHVTTDVKTTKANIRPTTGRTRGPPTSVPVDIGGGNRDQLVQNQDSGLSVGAAAGISVGIILVLVLFLILGLILVCRRRHHKKGEEFTVQSFGNLIYGVLPGRRTAVHAEHVVVYNNTLSSECDGQVNRTGSDVLANGCIGVLATGAPGACCNDYETPVSLVCDLPCKEVYDMEEDSDDGDSISGAKHYDTIEHVNEGFDEKQDNDKNLEFYNAMHSYFAKVPNADAASANAKSNNVCDDKD